MDTHFQGWQKPLDGPAATEVLREIAKTYSLDRLASPLLDHPKFSVTSGSSIAEAHHYGTGGLAVHTMEVVELCFLNNRYFWSPVEISSLFLAALYHDAGKMWDYELIDGHWVGTQHKRRIHHISRSAIFWSQAAASAGMKNDVFVDTVLHAILAHHGQREWGSPVAPNTRLAWLLHLCDGISARMYDADTLDPVKRKKG